MKRANFIPAPHYFNLTMACRVLTEAFGHNIYLVGSSLRKRDYRDVDVRCILDDDEYKRFFPDTVHTASNPLWAIMCASISLYLSQHSDLPIDFQIQQQTKANKEYKGQRHSLGIFITE